MASFNRVIILGNLTRDPEYKQLNSGQATCRLGLASNRQFKNKQTGSLVQEVCYVDIDVWGAQAESCRQYLQKGRAILVEGRLKFDSWKDANGQSRSKLSIVADSVIFLASSSPSSELTSISDYTEEKVTPKNQLEKDLLNQIEEIKTKSDSFDKKSKKNLKTSNQYSDSLDNDLFKDEFKDEPPFQDDLPF